MTGHHKTNTRIGKGGLLVLALFLFYGCASDTPDGYESGEENSAGTATTFDFGENAFSHPVPGLNFDQQTWFATGNSFFKQNWVAAPSSTAGRDGLGPLMNAFSCSGCHLNDGRGEPGAGIGPSTSALLMRISIPGQDVHGGPLPDAVYGGQLQNMGIGGVQPEGSVTILYEVITGAFADGTPYELEKPVYSVSGNYGAFAQPVLLSPRVGQQVIGLGLLEAIREEDILSHEDPSDLDGDGISGKHNTVWDYTSQTMALGRFGWKANQPSILQQVAGALAGDLGITSSVFPVENCTSAQQDCMDAPNGNDAPNAFEIDDAELQRMVFYMASLSVPGRRHAKDEKVLQGKMLFMEIGCADCHIPSYTTGNYALVPSLSGQKIYPYTDLLLHDMGPGLADGRPDYLADGQEWRTPPLWGIGLIETVNGHTRLLHDGRARNLQEAILWHGGEAAPVTEKFRQLSSSEREDLLLFLQSL